MRRFNATILFSIACGLLVAVGCGPSGERTGTDSSPMRTFSTEREFEAFMEEVVAQQEAPTGGGYNSDDFAEADSGADTGAPPENEDITNNQEDGVDEGGIVKNIGDHLVVLRQGRLYTVEVAQSGQTIQADSMRVAPAEELNQGVWYDEMLVHGHKIYVVGYRYGANVVNDDDDLPNWLFGATEVSSFSMDDQGQLSRGESTFFESNDYFSGSNYASRLVDGELIFYMPYYAFIPDPDKPMPAFPRFLQHQQGNTFVPGPPIFGPLDVIQPLDIPQHPTFHTVIQCQLPDDLTIDCGARSLLAEPMRQFYVSPTRIYLWSNNHVFAISQTDSTAKAHAVDGAPIDQFSFSERDDTLYVAVTRYLEEDELDADQMEALDEDPWLSFQRLELLHLPLSDFDGDGEQSLSGNISIVSDDIGWMWWAPNRHVSGWYLAAENDNLFAHHIATGHTEEFTLDGYVSRIESAPGIGALIVYNDYSNGQDLIVDSLRLDDDATLVSGTVLQDMAEGEWRSHGFFFRPDDDGGYFGLPVVGGSSGGWWGMGISNIAFFRAHSDGAIDLRGAVSSSDEAGGQCETSCVDWYGNTRPIFLRDRVYALMGSEIAEVAITDDDVEDVGERVILSIDE